MCPWFYIWERLALGKELICTHIFFFLIETGKYRLLPNWWIQTSPNSQLYNFDCVIPPLVFNSPDLVLSQSAFHLAKSISHNHKLYITFISLSCHETILTFLDENPVKQLFPLSASQVFGENSNCWWWLDAMYVLRLPVLFFSFYITNSHHPTSKLTLFWRVCSWKIICWERWPRNGT